MSKHLKYYKNEINERNSCKGNSRHLDIRYFFSKDQVDNKERSIKYCPKIILADFLKKQFTM